MRELARVVVVVAVVGCGGRPAPVALVPSSARLPGPAPADPTVRGAAYLTLVEAQLQERWAAFLEDCRLRLPRAHPLNAPALVTTYELAIGRTGAIVSRTQVETSGNGDFDTAVADVLADASPLPAPPRELMSDDELVHLRWQFARDRRQAGAATARVVTVELPLLAVVEGMLGRGELVRAARRVAAAPASDPERAAAASRVMVSALREALDSPDGGARRVAVEACGRAGVRELAGAVRAQLASGAAPELRVAAITAVAALGDHGAVPVLLAALREDLAQGSRLALARAAALVALGHGQDAADAVRAALDGGGNPIAVTALAVAPVPGLADKLAGWAHAGDRATRSAVCAALPSAAPGHAGALIASGLRDPDASVRAACAEAGGRGDRTHPAGAIVQRLRELVRDRDAAVRARSVAALAALDPAHPVGGAQDRAAEVRVAAVRTASEAELRGLVLDRDADVRAAALSALIALGGRATPAAIHAADDPSPAVRCAAIPALSDLGLLARLARDDSPEVATAALLRLTALAGRSARTAELLEQLAAAPAGSAERARIAFAWLLAS